ncbi:App1 family protein [Klugiella xanthotipulae]|uniref:Phosphatidate phosphatase APP1 n=1 Tax=Klugiella xanthotipulae TaxID=244735 RepID=A0A543HT42_9MICO|nr:phosphatase domain-containing protein [Klugiella xanthotipulae]TQM61429.1 phosphatidate phosphatase APP1 [Klugiella xanthotipulae]
MTTPSNEPEDSATARPVAVARLDDWLHERRARRAVKRGRLPSIIPYIGYGRPEWIRVLGRALYLKPEVAMKTEARADEQQTARVRGWRSFTSVHVPFITVTVEIDGVVHDEVVTDRGGVLDAIIPTKGLQPGWHTVSLRVNGSEASESPVFVVDPSAHFGVVSDVDDTVMITALPKPFVAAWNSFVRHEQARVPTPGMSVFIDRQVSAHPGSPIIYLSTGAWNVAPTLTRFLARNLYPMGPLLLTDWGPTPDRWFRSGREHKARELRRLAVEFPDVRWLLIGDDGQHDEELYHEFSLQHPQNVAAVAIRQLSTGEAVLAGGRSTAELHTSVSGVPWVYGPDGATLARQINELDT